MATVMLHGMLRSEVILHARLSCSRHHAMHRDRTPPGLHYVTVKAKGKVRVMVYPNRRISTKNHPGRHERTRATLYIKNEKIIMSLRQ